MPIATKKNATIIEDEFSDDGGDSRAQPLFWRKIRHAQRAFEQGIASPFDRRLKGATGVRAWKGKPHLAAVSEAEIRQELFYAEQRERRDAFEEQREAQQSHQQRHPRRAYTLGRIGLTKGQLYAALQYIALRDWYHRSIGAPRLTTSANKLARMDWNASYRLPGAASASSSEDKLERFDSGFRSEAEGMSKADGRNGAWVAPAPKPGSSQPDESLPWLVRSGGRWESKRDNLRPAVRVSANGPWRKGYAEFRHNGLSIHCASPEADPITRSALRCYTCAVYAQ
jgi:hypothetical protein